ncbi:MAG TPA: LCP family protein [Pseudonocardiaceae bacterium]
MDDWPREPQDQGPSWDDAQPPRSGNLPQPPRDQPRSGDLAGRLNPPTSRQDRPSQGRPNQPQRQPGRGVPPRLPRPSADSIRGRLPDAPRDPAPDRTRRVPTEPPPGTTRRVPNPPPPDATRRVAAPRPSDDAATQLVPADLPDDDRDQAGPPPRRGLSRRTKIALNAGKVVVALAAVIALGATGAAWAELQHAENGVTTDDVIDPNGSSGNGTKHADGAEDILLVGLDSRTDVQGNPLPQNVLASLGAGVNGGEINTDTMILLHIPDSGGPAVGISIPRDSWVNIPGYGTSKINAAYAEAKATATKQLKAQGDTDSADVERKSNQAGAKETIAVVQNLTGVHIDHYAEVNLYGFDQLSQAIGGVPVCLNHAVKDSNSGADFPAGYFTVEGVQALAFVRQRHNIPGGSTDLQREARQQEFLASMAHKVLSAGTLTSPSELNNLITAIQKSITIDSGWNLVDFAGQMAGMSSGNLKFETVPTVTIDYWPSGHVGVGENAVEVNPAQIAAFVQGATGTTPAPAGNAGTTSGAGPSSTTAPATTGGNAATTVDVQNGSGVNGLAAKVLSKLTKAGFGQGTAATITNRTSSVIYFHTGQQDAANAVAGALGGKVTVTQGPSVPSGHVWVDLGTHYSSEGITTAADTWSVSGVNQSLIPQEFIPAAHQSNPSSISDSGSAPPCID